MANGGGNRPIAPVRKLIAAVLGTVATFVILFGLGMTSWAIVALGVALLALAIALATVRGGGRTWVVGAGHVHSASEPPTQYAFGRCELQLVIDAPGLPPRSKKIIEPRVPVSKWPSLGQTLPIRVALDDPRHVRVLWDEVLTHTEAGSTADLPPEFATVPPDEVLIGQEAPPWAGRMPEEDFHEPSGEAPDGPLGGPSDSRPHDAVVETVEHVEHHETVRVRQRPGRPVVLEGTVVERSDEHRLPRRATPAPRTPAEERFTEPRPTEERLTTSATSAGDEPADQVADPVASGRVTQPSTGPAAGLTDPMDPLDPLDLPLDDPEPGPVVTADRPPAGDRPAVDDQPQPAADRTGAVDAEELDEAIFGFDPDAADLAAPISGVGITLLVTELSRSLEFYRDRLGFTEVDRGAANAVLSSGTTRLVLREVTGAQPISRRLVHVNLDVDDIQSAYQRLRESGVRFTYPPRVVNRGSKLEVWAAAFRDPDGHGIALTQWRELAEA
ncbi:VOC family protein [Verrucosispora sp. WMMA2044]|uniref:VOC family protein n=1 Tax=Verrucosispora sp. WMMA2044 TaxID=3016419 RepID=UPI00248CA676|nr:VOC family protein [Verrucosispora sp. WMMA2044]WBB49538.1 VOC family protein [Verrucosispora sp. WMMA2044]